MLTLFKKFLLMKNLSLALILIVSTFFGFAQKSFEGTVTFKIKATGEGMEQAQMFMPDSYEYKFKDGDILFKLNGGMAAAMVGDILIKGNEGESYMIKNSEKTVYKISDASDGKSDVAVPEITKEDETIDILGYKCQKYKVVTEVNGQKSVQYIWATNDFQIDLPKKKKMPGTGGNIFVDGLKGFPLKITTNAMGISMVMTATEVKEEKLDKSLFQVPDDYEVKQFNPASFLGH